MKPLFRKAVMKMFEEKSAPKAGIRTFFKTPSTNMSDTLTLDLDIVRNERKVAINVERNTGGNYNKFDLFANKEYQPPFYNEYTDFKAEDMFQRMPGSTEYAPLSNVKTAERMASNLVKLGHLIDRAEIKQCHDALFLGQVTLINGDVISFNKKATHDKVPSTKWDDTSPTIFADIEAQIDVIEQDAKRHINEINMVCDPKLIEYVIGAVKSTSADYQDPQLFKRSQIVMPEEVNMSGLKYHGKFSIAGYNVFLWSFSDRYKIPVGYGLANEGDETTYIPSGSAVLFPSDIRFDMVYAGVETNDFSTNGFFNNNFGVKNFNPKVVKGARVPYAQPDMVSFQGINYGMKAAPLAIPTEIDAFATISSALT